MTIHSKKNEQPTTSSLLKATAIAAIVAAVLTVTTILPAEYGIDPTGFGSLTGLTAIANASEEEAGSEPAVQPQSQADSSADLLGSIALSPVTKQPGIAKSSTLQLTLEPNKGAELKAKMEKGQSMVFSWSSGGQPLSVDMHGEEVNAKADEYTSYWLERGQSEGNGHFVAPFTGTHGWYWKNKGTEPVTVTVTIHGFFADFYKP